MLYYYNSYLHIRVNEQNKNTKLLFWTLCSKLVQKFNLRSYIYKYSFLLSVNVLRRDRVATMSTSYTGQFPKVLLTSYRFNDIIFHSDTYYIFFFLRVYIDSFQTVSYSNISWDPRLAFSAKAAKSPFSNTILFKIKSLLTLKYILYYYTHTGTYRLLNKLFIVLYLDKGQ